MRFPLSALAAFPLVVATTPVSSQIYNQSTRSLRAPDVTVWVDRFTYNAGERIHSYFRADSGAFVTIVRVTTAGDLVVLYPQRPSSQRPYREGMLRNDEVPFAGYSASTVSEPRGVGFVFAIASYRPFDYRQVAYNDRWNTWKFASGISQMKYGLRGYPDPLELIGRFIDQTVSRDAEYSTDYIQYEVVRSDYYYRNRSYSNYNFLYHACMVHFYGYAEGYCNEYALGGYPFYYPVIIARNPTPYQPPGKPSKTMPRLPGKITPDPVVGGEEISKVTPQPAPVDSKVDRANAQRAWWNARGRDIGRDNGNPGIADRSRRAEPQTLPEVYRGSSTPRTESVPSRRSEPVVESNYEPIRYEPIRSEPIRSEPIRSEPIHRAEPQAPPIMRSEPMNQGKYERPVQPAPVIRQEAPRIEVRASPPPAPPPPPPQSKPTTVNSSTKDQN